jgi:hypothetical protein
MVEQQRPFSTRGRRGLLLISPKRSIPENRHAPLTRERGCQNVHNLLTLRAFIRHGTTAFHVTSVRQRLATH